MESFPGTITEVIRFVDIIDILLVAALFFLAITWVRRSKSGSAARRLLVLVLVYALVYLATEVFDLYLMRRVLSVLFFVVLIALVLVFQADIRRFLDQLGSWRRHGAGQDRPTRSPVELLEEAAAHLARERIGALIAIRGSEPWESHLHGGVELNGTLSPPLLHSIFQPDTPGHDGAVLVEGNRVTRFAVHLPLATRLPAASRYGGTRHAAGLGLAEVCDALVIIVSEERGTISLAEHGALVEASAGEFAERLHEFWRKHHEPQGPAAWAWLNRQNGETAASSIGLAVLIWFLFVYSADTIVRTYRAPVEVRNLPVEWRLASDSIPSALVTLSGSEQAFERLRPGQLRISLDLDDPIPGRNEVAITEEALSLPSGIDLAAADPPAVSLEAQRQRALTLPIQLRTTGPIPEGMAVVPHPEEVRVLVPEAGDSLPRTIFTEPVDPRTLVGAEATRVQLVLPPGVRLAPDQDTEIEVQHRPRGADRRGEL